MKKIKILLSVFVLIGAFYSGAWFYMAHVLGQKLDQFYYGDAAAMGIKLYGPEPEISGFPFAPKITYLHGFEKDSTYVSFDELIIEGFPIPSLPITMSAPNGAIIEKDGMNMVMDYADLKFITPKSLPKSGYRYHVEKWQKEVGKINITSSKITYKDLSINSKGYLGLDSNLQLDVFLNTKTYDYETLINFFISTGTIKPFVGALTLSGMNGMAKTDEQTGEKFVDLDFVVKKQQVAFGPIKLKNLPPIQWR